MNIKVKLRIICAVVFAIIAVIFSELIPPLGEVNQTLIKALVTLVSALVGFLIFPDIASFITKLSISLFNFSVSRITNEVSSQMLRLQKDTSRISNLNTIPQVGGITINKPLIIDTSAIIDGRILDIAKTNFLSGMFLIPNFVLLELQQVADSSDALKRSRGRRGFEVVADLKKVTGIRVEVWEQEAGGKAVDEKLLRLAKSLHGRIVTTDFNLNKLAGAHGVIVLNVNDLANAMKTVAIPGEKIKVKIIHIGKDPSQGVGYLPDGTMIVIEDGGGQIGQEVLATVTRNIQGSAGRMIFTRIN